MWSVEDVDLIPIKLDFSSSAQGCDSATAVEAGGVRLFNAVELVDVASTLTQVEICECCGVSHCSPGGWVTFRRIGDRVVWLPAWDEMEKGSWEASEYSPPSFLRRQGAPVFSSTAWDRLRKLHGGLPGPEDLPWINSRETARLCQGSAPGHVLGEYPREPRMRRDLLIAVTDGDLEVEAAYVDECLQTHFRMVRQMATLPVPALKSIEFWLDLPDITSWTSFARSEDTMCFLIDGSTALIREGGLSQLSCSR